MKINNVATTHPNLIKYFLNKEDAYTHSHGSGLSIKVKCPICGFEKNTRVSDLVRQGFSCSKCSDGIPYTEKVMFNVLEQLNVSFITQLNKTTLEWCEGYKYDFYSKDFDCIIETHGVQHYIQKQGFGRLLSIEQENDKLKQELALSNGIKNYIVVDCRESNLEFIKQSILSNDLMWNLFDLTVIDWEKVEEFTLRNRVKEVCDLWNQGKDAKDICLITSISRPTICLYLNKGNKVGLCKYDGKSEMLNSCINNSKDREKKVICITNGEEYNSIQEASDFTKIPASNISKCCSGDRKSAGKDKITKEKLIWKFI